MAGPSTEQEAPRGLRVDLGAAWGLIAGAALGSVLMALTGELFWVIVGPGAGLAIGLLAVGLFSGRGDTDATGADATDAQDA